jgi:class 3 adenylate cyclase
MPPSHPQLELSALHSPVLPSDQVTTFARRRLPSGATQSRRDRLQVVPPTRTERKHATILFTDLRGSMDISRRVEPEAWWDLTNELFALACRGVYRFGGWIANFTGDGVSAVFEGDDSPNLHAHNACDAALWLRDAMVQTSARLARSTEVDLMLRMGLNSGDVVTGTIGDLRTRFYTASGYAVALAKRIESLARPGRIYLSQHTAALLGNGVTLSDLGAFEVKGACAPVGVYELVGRNT